MLFRVQSQNSETIQINSFAPQDSAKDKDACVLVTMEVLIPYDSGEFAAAAAVLGIKEKLLDTFMKPEAYDPAQKEMFEHAAQVLANLAKSIVPDNVSPILKP